MTDIYFSEEDKQKVIEYLNYVNKYASFTMNTSELINYYKLLHNMQTKILPKLESNILEIKKIVNTKSENGDA